MGCVFGLCVRGCWGVWGAYRGVGVWGVVVCGLYKDAWFQYWKVFLVLSYFEKFTSESSKKHNSFCVSNMKNVALSPYLTALFFPSITITPRSVYRHHYVLCKSPTSLSYIDIF